MDSPCRRIVAPRVLVKLGGALLTDKQSYRTLDQEALVQSTKAVADAVKEGAEVLLVLGAGSFGHSLARHLRLNEGYLPDWTPDPVTPWGGLISDQMQGVRDVRSDLDELSKAVKSQLTGHGLDVRFIPARDFVRLTEVGEVEWTPPVLDSEVVMTQGDVVDRHGSARFGILSGDELMWLFASSVSTSHAVFGLDGIDGLMTRPPGHPDASLIEWFAPGGVTDISVDEVHDVTGGMGAKIEIASMMSSKIPVTFVNGEHASRLTGAILGKKVKGTLVSAEPPSV